MSSVPTQARVVIIGAGIVGNSMAWHLANLGWRDILLLEKGTLPNPGGSTGHASNFIFLTDHSKEMAALTGARRLHGDRWDRGRQDAGADGRAEAAHGLGHVVGCGGLAAPDPG